MRLRAATALDGYLLWVWANDPETRASSGDREVISWVDHLDWLSRKLADAGSAILIGESAEDQPVGSIRFESEDGWRSARLSYLVAPEARGRGFGRALLVEGTALVRRTHPAVRIEAAVVPANQKSRRLFELLAWDESTGADGLLRFVDRGDVAV